MCLRNHAQTVNKSASVRFRTNLHGLCLEFWWAVAVRFGWVSSANDTRDGGCPPLAAVRVSPSPLRTSPSSAIATAQRKIAMLTVEILAGHEGSAEEEDEGGLSRAAENPASAARPALVSPSEPTNSPILSELVTAGGVGLDTARAKLRARINRSPAPSHHACWRLLANALMSSRKETVRSQSN